MFCLFGGWLWLRKNEKIRKALDIWCSTLTNQWTSGNYKLTHTQAAQMQNLCTVQTAETNCTGRTYFLLVATALFSEAHYTTKLPCSDRAVAVWNGRQPQLFGLLGCFTVTTSHSVETCLDGSCCSRGITSWTLDHGQSCRRVFSESGRSGLAHLAGHILLDVP